MTVSTHRFLTLTADDAANQSLARGPAGAALLHVERAWTGSGTWETAKAHLQRLAAAPVDAGDHAGLYYGVPAIAFVLDAAADRHPAYRAAAESLDNHVLRLARRRLVAAAARIERGEAATFAEYDLFYGLAGIGALLLRRTPGHEVLGDILRYVVRLAQPHRQNGLELPGWWVAHDPDKTLPTPGGHANLGMAHGAAGLLALLAVAATRGCIVDGQHNAITRLAGWFDQWRQDSANGPWWPQWITRTDLRVGYPTQSTPGRPSWCYGTMGIARALHLAAIATHDRHRQQAAEDAIVTCLTGQLDLITEPGLCHGIAGVYQTAYRAARDSQNPAIEALLPELVARLTEQASRGQHGPGLLNGYAGVGLSLETARHVTPPCTGWDACLLIV